MEPSYATRSQHSMAGAWHVFQPRPGRIWVLFPPVRRAPGPPNHRLIAFERPPARRGKGLVMTIGSDRQPAIALVDDDFHSARLMLRMLAAHGGPHVEWLREPDTALETLAGYD